MRPLNACGDASVGTAAVSVSTFEVTVPLTTVGADFKAGSHVLPRTVAATVPAGGCLGTTLVVIGVTVSSTAISAKNYGSEHSSVVMSSRGAP